MTRRTLFAAAALCLSACLPHATRADSPGEARRSVQAAYNSMSRAVMKKNVKGATAYMDPEYVQINADDSQVTRDEIVDMLKEAFPIIKSVRASTRVQKISLKGNEATVLTKTVGRIIAVEPRTQQALGVDVSDVSREFWVKEGRGWILKRARVLKGGASLNGIPLVGF